MINEILERKVRAIDKTDIEAIGLMGSYSRGEEKKYSDVDIVCLLKRDAKKRPALIEIIYDKYVVTSFVTLEEMEKCFTDPESATENILGLQQAKVLFDPNGTFEELRMRAMEFEWTRKLQEKANVVAGKELVGWIEEVHKALQGLISNDTGRMLMGLHGLTYGLFKVVRIQKGILLDGENTFYKRVVEHYGINSNFAGLSEKAFGICEYSSIKERVLAGLHMFNEVTDELLGILGEEEKSAILLVKKEIQNELRSIEYSMN